MVISEAPGVAQQEGVDGRAKLRIFWGGVEPLS